MYFSQFLFNVFSISYRARTWYLKKLYVLLTPENAQVRLEDDTLLNIKPRYDYVQREIFLYQGKYTYESHIVKWIIHNVNQGETVVDIGSHIGYYLGPICRGVGQSGKAFFLEPLPENFKLLKKNICNNKFTMATPINIALSDQDGDVSFYPAINSSRSSLSQNSITDALPIKVHAVTLDQLCSLEGLTNIDLLQIDVEGAEVLAVRGASECLKGKHIKAILCEWHPQQQKKEFHTDPVELLAEMTRYGYDVFQVDIHTGEEAVFNPDFIHSYQHLVFRLA